MAIEKHLLEYVVRNQDEMEICDSPIVQTIVLIQPENVVQLVPYLDEKDTVQSRNARRILCLFDSDAVPFIANVMNNTNWRRRAECLEIIWAILSIEQAFLVPDILTSIALNLSAVFDDTTFIDEELSEKTEVDFKGRVCDLAFIVVKYLLDPNFDRSSFRSASNDERDAEINRLRREGYRRGMV